MRHKGAILDRHCAEIGRNPAEISRSAMALLALSDDASVVERARGTARAVIAGNPGEVKQQISDYISAGVDEIIIQAAEIEMDQKKQIYSRFIDEVATEFRPAAV